MSDSDEDYSGESSDSQGWDAAFNEKDAEWLASLPEVEREKVIYERAEEKKNRDEMKKIRRESKGIKSVNKSITARQNKAIEDIKARKSKIPQLPKKKRPRDSDEEEFKEQERSADEYDKWGQAEEGQLEEFPSAAVDITIEDINRCVVTRNKLEKWYGEPFFLKNVPGLFVRVSTGGYGTRLYRLAEIMSIVEATKPYKLGQKECRHIAQLRIAGEPNTKKYELEYVSNGPLTDLEFSIWLDAAHEKNEVPTKAELEAIADKIFQSEHYVYTANDFKEQIKKNKERNPNAFYKASHEILNLKNKILEETNTQKLEKLRKQLKEEELKDEARIKALQGKVGASLAAINQRNSNINYILTRTAGGEEEEEVLDGGQAFARTPTNSRNAWLASRTARKKDADSQSSSQEIVTTPQPKKPRLDSEPTFSLAEVPFAIQLDNASLLNPKPQTGKALSNVPTPTRQISANARTMSFSDYKRLKEEQDTTS
jgi:RNA polymerase-associated protein RTF1